MWQHVLCAISSLALVVPQPLLINEVVADSVDPAWKDDWIELYAVQEVRLSDFALQDQSVVPFTLPDILVPKGVYTVLRADDKQLPFKLSKDGDSVSLVYAANLTLVDAITFASPNVVDGFSYGRFPGGAARGELRMLIPTRGTPNAEVSSEQLRSRDELFNISKISRVMIELERSDWQNMLGVTDGSYSRANVTIDGSFRQDVGVRIKGQSSLVRGSKSGRLPLRINVEQFFPQSLCAIKGMDLDPPWPDPSLLRRVLASELYRAMRVPAARSKFAEVSVSLPAVPGVAAALTVQLGLYTMTETLDTDVVRETVGDTSIKGDALKMGETGSDLRWRGADWAAYSVLSNSSLQSVPGKINRTKFRSDFIAFVRTIHSGSDEELALAVDVEQTLRYLAAVTVLGDFDSYLGATASKYYLFLESGSLKFFPLPADGSGSFGASACGCIRTPEESAAYAIEQPACAPLSERPLAERMLANPVWRSRYLALVRDGAARLMTLPARIAQLAVILRPRMADVSNAVSEYSLSDWEASLDAKVDRGEQLSDDANGWVPLLNVTQLGAQISFMMLDLDDFSLLHTTIQVNPATMCTVGYAVHAESSLEASLWATQVADLEWRGVILFVTDPSQYATSLQLKLKADMSAGWAIVGTSARRRILPGLNSFARARADALSAQADAAARADAWCSAALQCVQPADAARSALVDAFEPSPAKPDVCGVASKLRAAAIVVEGPKPWSAPSGTNRCFVGVRAGSEALGTDPPLSYPRGTFAPGTFTPSRITPIAPPPLQLTPGAIAPGAPQMPPKASPLSSGSPGLRSHRHGCWGHGVWVVMLLVARWVSCSVRM